jgi:hypothetical protein
MIFNACLDNQPCKIEVIEGGLKSEVQHLLPSKVRRCKAPRREDINSSSLKIA